MTSDEIKADDHGAGQFPHEGCCGECRKLRQCNACGAPIYGGLRSQPGRSSRCTNGRCMKCHRHYCTEGGSVSPGHGFWRKGTRPKHLVRYPEKRGRCAGAGSKSTRFPGDEDRCEACGKWVVVKRDGTLRSHRGIK